MKIINMTKNITSLLGSLLIVLAGLVFVIVTDLKIRIGSGWLFFAIIFSFGSGLLFLLAESFKHKPTAFYCMKSGGFLLSVGYIVFGFVFKNSEFCKNIKFEYESTRDFITIFTIIFAIICCVVQLANLVINIIFKVEDI